ncbi:MAG: ATP-binding protein [Acidobacteria bacterium]|nr:ATP-binding protein [Acidobacteriota bacterium]MCI0723872.1 ATP-binding protein [Acidobacteriota bacterium]
MQTKKILFSLEVTIVFLSLTVYLWHTIETTEHQRRHQAIEINANQLKNGIEAFVNEKISILMQVRNFWLHSKSIDHDEFLGFCRSIISQIPGFQAIEFGDTTGRVVWVEPFLSNESVEDFDMTSEPRRYQTLQRAIQKKTVAVTPVLNLVQGGKGFVVIVPIFRTGKYEGAVVGVFKIETLFSLIFDSVLRQQYNIAVFDGEVLIYGDEPAGKNWRQSAAYVKETVTVRDQNWSLDLWLREPEGDITFLGSSVLVLGFALSLVLGSLVWVLSTKAEQADIYAALLEVSHQLGASPDMQSVFRVTGETCLRMTGVDRCGIFLWNEPERQFEPAWVSIDQPEKVERFLALRLKYGDMALVSKVVDEKRSVLVHTAKLGLINPSLVRLFNIRSVFVVPLVSKGNLIGAMTLDHEGKQRRFSSREQAIISGIAAQSVIAIENVRLLTETRKQSELIGKKNKELESFLFIVSHDLRNPLLALGGMASLLVEDCGGELSENGKHYLSRIQANLSHMEMLIKDVLELSKIGRTETQLDKIDVQETLGEILMDSQVKSSQQHVQVCNRNQVQTLRYNRHGLRHIFSNLIENALKFCSYQESARVEIGSEEDEKEYRFYVKDNGVGIDPKFHQSIFDLFYRIQDLKSVEGTGVGLTIVQRVLETYGGRIWVDSEKGRGTTFFFAIPKML